MNNSEQFFSEVHQSHLKHWGIGDKYTYNVSTRFGVGKIITQPFNLDNLINHVGWDVIPTESGWYFLYKDNDLVYVGMSMNLQVRLQSHCASDIDFDKCSFVLSGQVKNDLTCQEITEIEYEIIDQLRPALNKKIIKA